MFFPEQIVQTLAQFQTDIEKTWEEFLGLVPNRPRFVETVTSPFPQPYQSDKVQFNGFVVQSSYPQLKELCDKLLNKPRHGCCDQTVYFPLGRDILFSFNNLYGLHSTDPAPITNQYGYVNEKEMVIWVPIVGCKRFGCSWIPVQLATTFAYAFVNKQYSLLAGREIFGYSKLLGDLHIPSYDESTGHFSLKATVFKGPYSQEEKEKKEIIKVVRQSMSGDTPKVKTIDSAQDFIQGLYRRVYPEGQVKFSPTEEPISIFPYLPKSTVPVIALKQFRDIQNHEIACYQALVESYFKPTQFIRGKWLLDPFELNIYNYYFPSQNIIQTLGLCGDVNSAHRDENQDGVRLNVKLAFSLEFGLALGNGRVLWQA